jgi:CDGSH-type Zn-finger protein
MAMASKKRDGGKLKKGKIVVMLNGPYQVSGALPLRNEIAEVGVDGEPEKWVKGKRYPAKKAYALCRCGRSGNKPYCDRSHVDAGFDGNETASREPYARQAKKISGPGMELLDAEALCSEARFCHPMGDTWHLTLQSADAKKKKEAIRQACHCPSGRLVARDRKTGKPVEPDWDPALSLLQDPQKGVSGPIWVKGGVRIESEDGRVYETRNRVTLCRCGKSDNKPYCVGNHIRANFNDGDPSLKRIKKGAEGTKGKKGGS